MHATKKLVIQREITLFIEEKEIKTIARGIAGLDNLIKFSINFITVLSTSLASQLCNRYHEMIFLAVDLRPNSRYRLRVFEGKNGGLNKEEFNLTSEQAWRAVLLVDIFVPSLIRLAFFFFWSQQGSWKFDLKRSFNPRKPKGGEISARLKAVSQPDWSNRF